MMTPQQLVTEAKAQIREVDVAEAVQLLKKGALCLDVREVGEYEIVHLVDAINIPRGVLEFRISENPVFSDKSKTILLYCKTGGRSALAAFNLQRLGYTVLSISGGIEAWQKQGLPLNNDTNRYGNP